jgi:aminopeptidase
MLDDSTLVAQTALHLKDSLRIAMQWDNQIMMVVHDGDSAAARHLFQAYQLAASSAQFFDFGISSPAELLAAFSEMQAGDLVVLVQSNSFRMESFRIRVELFKRHIKVIEHSNLARIVGDEIAIYSQALAYDASYYRGVGSRLKLLTDAAHSIAVDSGTVMTLLFDGGVEPAKINLGDFSLLPNVGSLFPIGEIFTEARDLQRVNGQVLLYAFADLIGNMNFVDLPIAVTIHLGRVVDVQHAPAAFSQVIDAIRLAEGEVWLRELGFGINRAMGPHARVSDVGAFERSCGVHLSLGAKHGVFKKPTLRHKDARYHVDVFPLVQTVRIDDQVVFTNWQWQV